jgi:pimeloyl-ACP methyl ester carboxylesterase
MVHWQRDYRGILSGLAGLAWPAGGWWLGDPGRWFDRARLRHGLAIVLPGIEGWGPLNWSIARGLEDGGFPGAVHVHDWTTGFWPFFGYHLRATVRNRERATVVARLVRDYHDAFPRRPVCLVGHSGGGALAVLTLEALPRRYPVQTTVLLGPALSPTYSLGRALRQVENGLWHFWSPYDFLFLAMGTLMAGTVDGRHSVSAGFRGFALPEGASAEEATLYRTRLHQQRYSLPFLRQFHWGGHLAWANRVFIAETVAPLLKESVSGQAVA